MKIFGKIMSLTFAIIALFWSAILLDAFFSKFLGLNNVYRSIIGGADVPILLFIISIMLIALWIISIIGFTILNIIRAFKKSKSKILYVMVVICFVVMISGRILIPPQSYILSMYGVFCLVNKEMWIFTGFHVISIVSAILTGFSLLPLHRRKIPE